MFEVQHHAFRSARWWYTQVNNIDLEPEYQRVGGIWSKEDKQFLIDSIINNYDVPKLYVADFGTIKSPLNVEKKRYAVIDGKQRFEAIFEFFENRFPLSTDFRLETDPEIDIAGLYYKDLKERYFEIAADIEEYPWPVMHVVTDELKRINELFVRLNKGAALTGAEKRNAMIGPIPKIIRNVAKHEFFQECVRYQARRGQNLNASAKLILFEYFGNLHDTKKVDLDQLVSHGQNKSMSQLSYLEDRVDHNLNRMYRVFGSRDELLSAQGTVPLYYWFIRNLKELDLKYVRSFLLHFQNSLKHNRRKDDGSKNADLSNFDYFARSTNDQGSYEKRIEILNRWYGNFLASKSG